jgi:hypothetical protein
MARRLVPLLVVAGLVAAAAPARAQYFGRNKVQHRTFDFQVLKTERFDLYYYPEEAEAAHMVARMAERWHDRLARFFGHELRGRQAIILYAVPGHFRQTNAIEGLIGQGTGGVTEAIKRRVVLPMSGSLADTHHVLGHELVHAFQFDLTGDDPRDLDRALPDILQYPLWFAEGMAEYLSLGPVDPQTAMWLRDAALQEKLPHIRDLNDPKYFPYRWGHAFWAFVGAKYGDRAVASLIRSAANPRSDLTGLARQLGTDPDTLTAEWHRAIGEAAQAAAADLPPVSSTPRLALDRRSGGGRFNVGPRVSPNGRDVAFFSERDLFSVDLYLADLASGRITRRLSQSATDPHFDSLEFLNSAGAWSPDGSRLAVAAARGGRPGVAIIDPSSGDVVRELALPGLDDVLNPAFAPDGKSLVVSGNRGGFFDLYRVALEGGGIEPLTQDPFADLEPVFTPDGREVVFVTERFSFDLDTLTPGPLRLARVDLASRAVTAIPGFLTGKHLSPQTSGDGRDLVFIAEPDGVSNIYRMPLSGGPIARLSAVPTGVAGITASSPALSLSPATGRLVFSVFEDDGHGIYVLDQDDVVTTVPLDAMTPAGLLAGRSTAGGDVHRMLSEFDRGLPPAADTAAAASAPYRHGLQLDFIGQPTLSAGVTEFGGFVAGSASAYFSDMLGDRHLAVAAQVAGKLADFGGIVEYRNRRHRWNWAVAAEAMPYRFGYWTYEEDSAADQIRLSEVIERQTSRGLFGVTAYPFNHAVRLEMAAGIRSLSFTRDARIRVYSASTRELIERVETSETIADSLHLGEASVALVGDTSYFGATSPLYGSRYRFEIAQSAGSLRYTTVLGDWRRYFMVKRPVTVAVRGLHYGRYGRDSEHRQLAHLYAGYAELLRGYGFGSFSATECGAGQPGEECDVFDHLIGSRLVVGNLEVRLPLASLITGRLEYGRIPVDIGAFVDAAVTWTSATRPALAGGTRELLRSAGGFARVNVFGLFVAEVAASRPLDRPTRGWQWQIGIREGF